MHLQMKVYFTPKMSCVLLVLSACLVNLRPFRLIHSVIMTVGWSQVFEENRCPHDSNDLISYLTHPCRYDPLVKPASNRPLVVTARMFVYYMRMLHSSNVVQVLVQLCWHDESIQYIGTKELLRDKACWITSTTYQFQVQVLVQLRWNDKRLQHNSTSELVGDKARLWIPHIPFSSEHQSQVMGLNREDTVVTITPSGDILFSRRLHSQLLCQMKGGKFPFDLQQCYLLIENWKYSTDQVQLKWEEPNALHYPSHVFGLTEFDLTSFETTTPEHINDNQINFITSPETNKSSLIVVFHFGRKFGFYFWDYYVPSVVLVMTSWGSFWVDPEVVPCRVWLATCTMLGFFGLGVMNDAMPRLSQLKMNDLWFIGCNLFIFMSLAEFAFVNIVHRQETKPFPLKRLTSKYILKTSLMSEATPWKEKCSSCPASPELQRRQSFSQNNRGPQKQITIEFKDPKLRQRLSRRRKAFTGTHMTNQQMAGWIDCRSRTVFPVAFLVFNLLFWVLMFV